MDLKVTKFARLVNADYCILNLIPKTYARRQSVISELGYLRQNQSKNIEKPQMDHKYKVSKNWNRTATQDLNTHRTVQ